MGSFVATVWSTGDVLTATKANNWESQYADVATDLGTGAITVPWASLTSKPATYAPSAHQASHQSGGSDALSGTLAVNITGSAGAAGAVAWPNVTSKPTTFAPSAHQASHQSGGSDALSGTLAVNITGNAATANSATTAASLGNTIELEVLSLLAFEVGLSNSAYTSQQGQIGKVSAQGTYYFEASGLAQSGYTVGATLYDATTSTAVVTLTSSGVTMNAQRASFTPTAGHLYYATIGSGAYMSGVLARIVVQI